jgi:hypothetical protein
MRRDAAHELRPATTAPVVTQDPHGDWRNAYGNVIVCGQCRRYIEPDGDGYRHGPTRRTYDDWDRPPPVLDGAPMCPDGALRAWRGIVAVLTGKPDWLPFDPIPADRWRV